VLQGPLKPFESDRLIAITPERVRAWYADVQASGKLTTAARSYQLLKGILAQAVADGRLASNPCMIRGGAKASTGRKVEPPTAAELAIIVDAIDQRFRAMVLLAAWGGFRWGELTELRRGDIRFIDGGLVAVDVTRAVTHTTKDGFIVGQPKSEAGIRSVTLPPNLTPVVRAHLESIDPRETALLFPATKNPDRHLSGGSFTAFWRTARAAAKRRDMPFHALRHYGATRFAQTGATLKEIQMRIGHSTVEAAMRYQHAAGRDAELARRMQDLA
jgi:integrase